MFNRVARFPFSFQTWKICRPIQNGRLRICQLKHTPQLKLHLEANSAQHTKQHFNFRRYSLHT